MPEVAAKIKPLYFQEGEKIGGNTLMSKEDRFKILKSVRDLANASNMKFAVCREGFSQLNTAACDGSWLMPKEKPK
jgi:hypothetical protein